MRNFSLLWQTCICLPQMRLSYIYPNDYTRLSHLENTDSCVYPEKPSLNRDSPQKSSKYYHSRWSQTFSVKHMIFEENRPDGADYKCGIKGNLLLSSSETLPLVQAYMDQLNHKHPGYGHISFSLFTLQQLDQKTSCFFSSVNQASAEHWWKCSHPKDRSSLVMSMDDRVCSLLIVMSQKICNHHAQNLYQTILSDSSDHWVIIFQWQGFDGVDFFSSVLSWLWQC